MEVTGNDVISLERMLIYDATSDRKYELFCEAAGNEDECRLESGTVLLRPSNYEINT